MKDFLKSAEEQLKYNGDKITVLTELGDHLETKKEFFEDIGYDEASSAEKANEAMGNGEVIGQRLNYIHSPKNQLRIKITVIVTNLLFLLAYPTDKSSYFFPFLCAVLILICNFANTALAVKLKSRIFSIVLIIASCTAMWFSMPKLTYPICNLIMNQSASRVEEGTYIYLRTVLTLLIIAMIILPNAFNVYHCRQIKYLKNTKKQNKISSKIFIFCLIMPVLIALPAYPSYMLNDRLCEDQIEIRDELIAFAYDIDSKFEEYDYHERAKYLENSEYDFHLFINSAAYYTYDYYKGNWWLRIGFSETSDKYILHLENRMMNSSHKYLFTQYEKEEALLEDFGDDEFNGFNGGVIGKSTEEIKNRMKEVNLYSLTINKNSNRAIYTYNWAMDLVLCGLFGFDSYTFFIDNNGICYEYDLTLD